MDFIKICVGELKTNCYLCWNDKACVVIDPGDESDKILEKIDEINRPLAAILLTHAHFDHIGSVKKLKEIYPSVPVMAGEKDQWMLSNPDAVYRDMLREIPDSLRIKAERLLHDGDRIDVKGINFTVIETPGHTPGSVCYLSDGLLFSGDTLFCGGCGRCDLYGGDARQMKSSLDKLFNIKDNLVVLPGHGPQTTLDLERKNNRF